MYILYTVTWSVSVRCARAGPGRKEWWFYVQSGPALGISDNNTGRPDMAHLCVLTYWIQNSWGALPFAWPLTKKGSSTYPTFMTSGSKTHPLHGVWQKPQILGTWTLWGRYLFQSPHLISRQIRRVQAPTYALGRRTAQGAAYVSFWLSVVLFEVPGCFWQI